MQNKKTTNPKSYQDVMAMCEEWFSKLPNLPENGRQGLANAMSWIALIFGILGILGGIAGLGFLTALSPFSAMYYGVGRASTIIFSSFIGLASSVLLLLSFPKLKTYKISGWNLLFWSTLLRIVASLLFFSVGGVLVDLIGFYLLFQIKKFYK